MPTIANKEDFERTIRGAGEQLRRETADWDQLSANTKVGRAMQMALRKGLETPQGDVHPSVTAAIAGVADGHRDDVIQPAIDRAWDVYTPRH